MRRTASIASNANSNVLADWVGRGSHRYNKNRRKDLPPFHMSFKGMAKLFQEHAGRMTKPNTFRFEHYDDVVLWRGMRVPATFSRKVGDEFTFHQFTSWSTNEYEARQSTYRSADRQPILLCLGYYGLHSWILNVQKELQRFGLFDAVNREAEHILPPGVLQVERVAMNAGIGHEPLVQYKCTFRPLASFELYNATKLNTANLSKFRLA